MKKFPRSEKIFLYKYLYQTLKSRLALKESLLMYLKDLQPRHYQVISQIKEKINKNKPFWQALASTGGFSQIEIAIFKNLEDDIKNYQPDKFWLEENHFAVFKELYLFFQQETAMVKKMSGIFIYPIFLIFMLAVFLNLIIFWFIPKIEPLILKLNLKLPALIFLLSRLRAIDRQIFNKTNWPYFLIVLSFVWLLIQILKINRVKKFFSQLCFKIPILSRLLKIKYFLNLSFYLFLLTKKPIFYVSRQSSPATELNHQPADRQAKLIQAISYLPAGIGNIYLRHWWQKIKTNLEQGGKISDAWLNGQSSAACSWPTVFKRLVEIGEKTNSLHQEFYYCYKILAEEIEIEIKFSFSYLEPIFILLIASILGLLALSIYSIFTQIYSKIV